MGGAPSCRRRHKLTEESSSAVQWQIWPSFSEAKNEYLADPIMPPFENSNQVELRNILLEPKAQSELGKFAREIEKLNYLMCWVDVEEFKHTSSYDLRRVCGLKIVHNYVKETSPLYIKIDEQEAKMYQSVLYLPASVAAPPILIDDEEDPASVSFYAGRPVQNIPLSLFENLQKTCFLELYNGVFLPLKKTASYVDLRKGLNEKYNKIRLKDFDLFGMLGEGSFGIVVKCRKKTTGKMYAMKIMEKRSLLECAGWDRASIDTEVRALSALRHPLIIGMDYSFQTERFAMIAMELASGGTLRSISKAMQGQVLPEGYLRFYAAEIIVALHYLHCVGMIYRDMKPANVLVDETGHIKLADLGGVLDHSQGTSLQPISANGNALDHSFPFARSYTLCQSEMVSYKYLTSPERQKILFGTPGYASPEVMALFFGKQNRFAKGYCYMTDWWSLGVTIFVLCTGKLPFGANRCADNLTSGNTAHHISNSYKELFMPISYPTGEKSLSSELENLLSKFLTIEDTNRLGYGLNGLKDIQTHPFFEPTNWSDISNLKAVPPFVPGPECAALPDPVPFETHRQYMDGIRGASGACEDFEVLERFESWDYISPTTLRIEFGIANEMQQLEDKTKLQKMLCDYDSTKSGASLFGSTLSASSSLRSRRNRQSPVMAS